MDNHDFFLLAVLVDIFQIETLGHDKVVLHGKGGFFLARKFSDLDIDFGTVKGRLSCGFIEGHVLGLEHFS